VWFAVLAIVSIPLGYTNMPISKLILTCVIFFVAYGVRKCGGFRTNALSRKRSTQLSRDAQSGELEGLEDMTVVELKNVLRSMNLPVSGLKATLKSRIEEAAASKTAFAYGDRESGVSRIVEEGGDAPTKVKIRDIARLKQGDSSESGSVEVGNDGTGKDLWFDDSVFDSAEDASKGGEKRRKTMRDMSRKSILEGRYGKAVSGEVLHGSASPNFARGECVEATILAFGPLGASVVVHKRDGGDVDLNDEDDSEAEARGLILQQEVTYWSAVNGGQPDIGQTLEAYVLNIREDGKLDVTLRPVGYDKVLRGSEKIMQKIRESEGGVFPLGPKSSPEDVWRVLPGMSKREFKSSVGKIVNEGAAEIVDEGRGLRFVPENERVVAPKVPYSGKSPRGWRAPEGCTIFVANIPFTMDNMDLAGVVESRIGYGHIASVKVSVDHLTGKTRGFAHLEFFEQEATQKALSTLKGLRANGRELRFELPYSELDAEESERVKRSTRDWGESSQFGRRTVEGSRVRRPGGDQDLNTVGGGAWTTVYAGNLAYAVTEDSLKYSIEDALGEGNEDIVAAVRIAVDRDEPSRKRGFGYIDFYDEQTARMVCEKLRGMLIMGRPVQLDYEGPKKRAKFDDDENKTFIPGRNEELKKKKRYQQRGGRGGFRGGGKGAGGGGGRR
jgi:uncharacterized membrane protein YgcG